MGGIAMNTNIIEQKYFKNTQNEVFCVDIMPINQESWEQETNNDWVEITKEQAQELANPPKTAEQQLQEWRETLSEISPKQLRIVLLENGITSAQVDDAISAIEDNHTKQVAMIEWQYATGYQRNNPNLIMIATQLLGLSDEQIDAMWQSALLK